MTGYDPRASTIQVLPFQEAYEPPPIEGLSPTKTYRMGPGTPTGLGATYGRIGVSPTSPPGGIRPKSACPRVGFHTSTTRWGATIMQPAPPPSGRLNQHRPHSARPMGARPGTQQINSGASGAAEASIVSPSGMPKSAHPGITALKKAYGRPTSAPPTRQRAKVHGAAKVDPLSPKFLAPDGTWVQEQIPMPIAATQTQKLTTSGLYHARLPGSTGRIIQPVSAVISYNDVSPAITSEYISKPVPTNAGHPSSVARQYDSMIPTEEEVIGETEPQTTQTDPAGNPETNQDKKGGSGNNNNNSGFKISSYQPASHEPGYETAHIYENRAKTCNEEYGHPSNFAAAQWAAEKVGNPVDPLIRSSVDALYSQRVNAASMPLTWKDISRTRYKDLGINVVPGAKNTRLVGGRWRMIPRPVDGDVLFTDYYGPVGGGKDISNYYGRRYHEVQEHRPHSASSNNPLYR